MSILGRKYVVGCDIGSYSIKWIEGVQSHNTFKLHNYFEKPLPFKAVVDGKIRDFAAVAKSFKEILRESNSAENFSIGVQGSHVCTTKIKLPFFDEKEKGPCLDWEMEQYLTLEKDGAYVDCFQENNEEVLLVAEQKNIVDTYTQFLTDLNVTVHRVETPAVALEKTWRLNYPEDQDKTVALISLGATFASMTLFHHNMLHWTYPIRASGYDLTLNIQKELKLTFDEAENLKSGGYEGSPHPVKKLTEDFSEKFSDETLQALKYALMREPSLVIDKIHITGGAAKTFQLKTRLSEKLGSQVEALDPFKNVVMNKKQLKENTLKKVMVQAATALGLALDI